MNKKELRLKYKEARQHLSDATIESKSLAIANRLLQLDIWNNTYFHLFLTIDKQKEVDTEFILQIFAGALGNIIDSVFYGVIFNDSHHQLATLFAEDHYGSLFHGKVVDMFYFPIWEGNLPSWLPFWGGNHFRFFNAIFNVADLSISTGVGILIVFNKRAFTLPKHSMARIFQDKLE